MWMGSFQPGVLVLACHLVVPSDTGAPSSHPMFMVTLSPEVTNSTLTCLAGPRWKEPVLNPWAGLQETR
jgi:hypothetical protein